MTEINRFKLIINQAQLGKNISLIQKKNPAINKSNIIAVVKANAYGIGVKKIIPLLKKLKVFSFAVANLSEALAIQSTDSLIYILGGLTEDEIDYSVGLGFIIPIHTYEQALLVQKKAQEKNIIQEVNIVIDSGMGRIGVIISSALLLVEKIFELSHIKVRGIYSHFARLNPYDKDFTSKQLKLMENFYKILKKKNLLLDLMEYHCGRSHCLSYLDEAFQKPFNRARLGISLYGIDPILREKVGLESIISLKVKILSLRLLPKGWNIGYGGAYVLQKSSLIATLAIGYADLLIANWGKAGGWVLIQGKKCPILHISMDYTIVSVPRECNVKINDEATVIGKDGDEEIFVYQIAQSQNVVNYNILCSLSNRCLRLVQK